MSSDVKQQQSLIAKFQSDLNGLDSRELIRKYITTGMPVVLSGDEYFSLRSEIAKEFDIHPSAIILVGSSRTGFSM